jgi:proteasome assembly chaperone 3
LAQNPAAAPTTSQFLLGESIGPQSDLYTLYATSISQAIAAMNPNEARPVLLGIALKPLPDMKLQRETFHPIIDAIMANPVW